MKRRGSPTLDDRAGHGSEGGAISGRKKKGRLTTGGRIAVGLFFGVFLAVGLAATYALGVKPWEYVDDGFVGWRFEPGHVYTLAGGGECTINNLGFRSTRDTAVPKPDGVVRIA